MGKSRFYIGLVGVALVVTYLVWTGVSETMVYYLTPTELVAKVADDPSFHDVGVKVSGRVVPGTYEKGSGELEHHFVVRDLEHEDVCIPVVYREILPYTFTDDVEVVLEGRFNENGVFEATNVLTKCGSRYEASPEELRG
jgi:cytochrome c-type biogenesis protein CcmE